MSNLRPGEWARFGLGSAESLKAQQRWKEMRLRIAGSGALCAEFALQAARLGIGEIEVAVSGIVTERDLGGTSLYRVRDIGLPAGEILPQRILEHQPLCNVRVADEVRQTADHDSGGTDFVVRICRSALELRTAIQASESALWETTAGGLLFVPSALPMRGCPLCDAELEPGFRETNLATDMVTGMRGAVITMLCMHALLSLGTVEAEGALLRAGVAEGRLGTTVRAIVGVGCEACSGGSVPGTRSGGGEMHSPTASVGETEVKPGSVAALMADGAILVDVREPAEAAIVAIPGSTLVPLRGLTEHVRDWDRSRRIVLYCKVGLRSARAVALLREHGFTSVSHVSGGVLAWVDAVAPELPRY